MAQSEEPINNINCASGTQEYNSHICATLSELFRPLQNPWPSALPLESVYLSHNYGIIHFLFYVFFVTVIYNGALEKEIECDKFTCRCTQFVGFFFSQDQSYLIKMNIYKCRKEGVLYSRMLKYCEDPIQDDILCVCLNIA